MNDMGRIWIENVVVGNGGTDFDVNRRITNAKTDFAVLPTIWKGEYLNTNIKLRFFRTKFSPCPAIVDCYIDVGHGRAAIVAPNFYQLMSAS